MIFHSVEFITVFLPIVLVLYYLISDKFGVECEKVFLIVASFIFYSVASVKLLYALVISIVVNYLFAKIIERSLSKLFCSIAIISNALALCYYKYTNFFMDNITSALHREFVPLEIIAPLGISFWTFQQISFLVDTYKKEVKGSYFIDYLLYITFFPKLISGPITRYNELVEQFKIKATLKYSNIFSGLNIFTIGLIKKGIIANVFSEYVSLGYTDPFNLSFLESWFTILSFSAQIFFDFSGYTDMALGSAKMFNINLPDNFNLPYSAVSVQDFWRRWHISLSKFLRDYLYFPLGGSRCKTFNIYRNILITFVVYGVWHGASLMFILWGLIHGIGVCINKLWSKTKINLPRWVSVVFTFIYVSYAWIFFKSENFKQAADIIKSSVNVSNFFVPRIKWLSVYFRETGHCYNDMIGYFCLATIGYFLFEKIKCCEFLNVRYPTLKFKVYCTSIVAFFWGVYYHITKSVIEEFLYFKF